MKKTLVKKTNTGNIRVNQYEALKPDERYGKKYLDIKRVYNLIKNNSSEFLVSREVAEDIKIYEEHYKKPRAKFSILETN